MDLPARVRSSTLAAHLVGGASIGPVGAPLPLPPIETERQLLALREEVELLRAAKSGENAEHAQQVAALEAKVAELNEAKPLAVIEAHVHAKAMRAGKANPALLEALRPTAAAKPMWVMSVDIRGSTELMLQARNAHEFAMFITSLCAKLMTTIQEHCGVVDKFTGDGILAFFPDSFSGVDAGYLALSAAQACHAIFEDHYDNRRSAFHLVLLETGLGIGIDYGDCHIVSFGDGVTVVGIPVVHACRLGGAPAGTTYVNQSVPDVLISNPSVALQRQAFAPKNQGKVGVYSAEIRSPPPRPPTFPEWWLAEP